MKKTLKYCVEIFFIRNKISCWLYLFTDGLRYLQRLVSSKSSSFKIILFYRITSCCCHVKDCKYIVWWNSIFIHNILLLLYVGAYLSDSTHTHTHKIFVRIFLNFFYFCWEIFIANFGANSGQQNKIQRTILSAEAATTTTTTML